MEWHNCISYARGHQIKWVRVHGHNHSIILGDWVVRSVLWTTSNGVSQVHFIAFDLKRFYQRLSNAFDLKRFIGDCPIFLNKVVY